MQHFHSFKPFSLLLTGTPGRLCEAVLSKLGDSLPALTRVRCLVEKEMSAQQISEWRRLHQSVTEIISCDLRDAKSVNAACENMRGGVIFHAAEVMHPRRISEYAAINRDGTLALAAAAKKAGVKRFVYLSSLAAQGSAASKSTLLSEEMPCRPLTDYGVSKFEAERGLTHLHEAKVFEVVILRTGPFYGIPVSPEHVELFKRFQTGSIRIVARGEFTRSWSDVNETAAAVVRCLYTPEAAGQVFNLCDAEPRTQLDVFQAVADALRVSPNYHYSFGFAATWARFMSAAAGRFDRYSKARHLIADQNRHLGASSVKAQKVLRFDARVNVRDGLRREIAWARDHNLIN